MSNASPAVAEHHEMLARKTLDEDIHYLGSIAQMAGAQEVVADEEVLSAGGIKLIDKGVAIDSNLRQRLVNHRLLKPIDQSLVATDGVTGKLLAWEAANRVNDLPLLRQLLDDGRALPPALEMLEHLALPGQLAFKLSVMRARMPWLFDHILTTVLISHCLAQRMHLPAPDTRDAVLVALVHDLGELHTDPALLDRRHPMGDDELRHIDVHPITGYLIAKEILPGHPAVAAAVLQHHEKLDGSGYPNRLQGAAIGLLPRLLAVADACASIVVRGGSSERLSAWMRLNRQKYDRDIIARLLHGLRPDEATADSDQRLEANEVEATAQLLRRWIELSSELRASASPEMDFLFERMGDLRVILLQFGLDPDRPQSLQALAAEPEFARELAAAFDEVRRQITDIQRESLRRREALGGSLAPTDLALLDGWLTEIRDYLRIATPEGHAPAPERRSSAAPSV